MKLSKRIIPTIFIVVMILAVAAPAVLFINAFVWGYNVENFDSYKRDFEAVAEYCRMYINERRSESLDANNYFSYDAKRGTLYYSESPLSEGDYLELTDELRESLKSIASAFPSKDARLDVIRCYDEAVYFCTHAGQYSLVYSPAGRPVSTTDPCENEDVFVKKESRDWYHVRKNNH